MLPITRDIEKKTTTAELSGTKFDAIAHIIKVLGIRYSKIDDAMNYSDMKLYEAVMSEVYTGTVTCDEKDDYDEAVGESEAVKKAMSNHNKAFKRALTRWQIAMIKRIINVSPDTFDTALHKVRPCKCNKQ